MPRPPSLRDLAKRAGVHHTTVSRALRNDPTLSEATRLRLQRMADESGYRSNPLLSAWMRGLKDSKNASAQPLSAALAYLVCFNDLERWKKIPAIHRYYEGAKARAAELGYSFETFWLREPGMTGRRMSGILGARGIQGIVVGSATTAHAHVRLAWENFASVAQGFSLVRPNLSRTANHYGQSMHLALRHVRLLGYRRVGHVVARSVDARINRMSVSAFLYYQEQIHESDRVSNLYWEGQSDALLAWFERNRPEAIISDNVGVLDVLHAHGVQTPRDCGFASLDWQAENGLLAGVDYCAEVAGRAAIDLIVQGLIVNRWGIPDTPVIVFTPGKWIPGPSLRQHGTRAPLPFLHGETLLEEY